ncbi:MAG: tetratricopeptide repeat protein [Gemmatimonas sp.]
MLGLTTDSRATRDDWSDDNARGLAFAALGAWSDAADAFSNAVDVATGQADVASHDALALVLNNLAQASFRAGRVDDGIRHAQRACSLRAALIGEDAIGVARARADLAVMLGSVGRVEEGLGLLSRAIAGIERSAGDEDLRLSTVLENAARLAMAAGQPATAEPYLIRLHALLAAHELPTDPADLLLARIAAYRRRASEELVFELEQDVAEFDDQPLRDAVQVTDQLLRSTPHSSRAITPAAVIAFDDTATTIVTIVESEPLVNDAAQTPAAMDTVLHGIEISDIAVGGDIFGNATFDLVDLAPTAHERDEDSAPPVSHNVLGFVVEYGTPTLDPMPPDLVDMEIVAPPASVRIPTPPPMRVTERTTPRGSPIVMPSPASSHRAQTPHDAPRLTLHNTDDLDQQRRIRRPNIRAGRAMVPRSSRGMLIAGAVTTAIAAGVGWLVWARGF